MTTERPYRKALNWFAVKLSRSADTKGKGARLTVAVEKQQKKEVFFIVVFLTLALPKGHLVIFAYVECEA